MPANKKIKEEKERLQAIFSDIDPNKREFVLRQINTLAWLNISIDQLKKDIEKVGTMVRYDNGGGQSGLKENPDVKTFLSYQKNVNAITNQLIDLVPATARASKLQALMDA